MLALELLLAWGSALAACRAFPAQPMDTWLQPCKFIRGSGSALLHSPLPDALPIPFQLPYFVPMLKDSSDELGEESLHETTRAGPKPFQEANMSPMGCDQQCHVGQVPGGLHGNGWTTIVRRSLLGATPLSGLALRSPHSPCSGEKGSSEALRQSTGTWMRCSWRLGLAAS